MDFLRGMEKTPFIAQDDGLFCIPERGTIKGQRDAGINLLAFTDPFDGTKPLSWKQLGGFVRLRKKIPAILRVNTCVSRGLAGRILLINMHNSRHRSRRYSLLHSRNYIRRPIRQAKL